MVTNAKVQIYKGWVYRICSKLKFHAKTNQIISRLHTTAYTFVI